MFAFPEREPGKQRLQTKLMLYSSSQGLGFFPDGSRIRDREKEMQFSKILERYCSMAR